MLWVSSPPMGFLNSVSIPRDSARSPTQQASKAAPITRLDSPARVTMPAPPSLRWHQLRARTSTPLHPRPLTFAIVRCLAQVTSTCHVESTINLSDSHGSIDIGLSRLLGCSWAAVANQRRPPFGQQLHEMRTYSEGVLMHLAAPASRKL